jgi:hypothetical protein
MRVHPDGSLMVALNGLHPTNRIIMSPAARLAGNAGVTEVEPLFHAPAVWMVMAI